MKLDYAKRTPRTCLFADPGVLICQLLTLYFLISSVTLPFMDMFWLGEIPLLALIQVPKLASASWLRTQVVMPIIRAGGWSLGSFSPDYGRARPYALAVVYLAVFGLTCVAARIPGPFTTRRRRWLLIAGAAALIDCAITLWFAGGPGLSLY